MGRFGIIHDVKWLMPVLAVGVAAEVSAATLPVRLSFEYPNGTKGGVHKNKPRNQIFEGQNEGKRN